MTRLPTGMYQPVRSMIHEVNDTVKLICFFILAVSMLATDSVAGFIAAVTVTAAIVYLAQVDVRPFTKRLKQSTGLLVSILLVNLLFFTRNNAWLSWWVFSPSLAGLINGFFIALRTALILCLGDILAATTPPLKMSESMQRILSPLRFLRIPTGELAIILSASIQFIPILFEEAELIRKGQTARGAKLANNSYFDKAKAFEPLIIPIFVSAFTRAIELAEAIEAQGYQESVDFGNNERIILRVCDYSALIVSAALCALEFIVL